MSQLIPYRPPTHYRFWITLPAWVVEASKNPLAKISLLVCLIACGTLCAFKAKSIPASKAEIIKVFLDSLSSQGYRLHERPEENAPTSVAVTKKAKPTVKLIEVEKKVTVKTASKYDASAAYLEKHYPKQFSKTNWERMKKQGKSLAMQNYINKYRKLAKDEQKHSVSEKLPYGIPWQITIIQGALESGSGSSSLATGANNHFGVKGTVNGAFMYVHDDCCHKRRKPNGKPCHQGEKFKSYPSVWYSYRDHTNVLLKSRYARMFRSPDWRDWAAGLERDGYATSQLYTESIAYYILLYDLR